MRQFLSVTLAGILGIAGISKAAPILAYSSSPFEVPDQSYGGNFGMDFHPTQTISVTELGLYSGLDGGGTGAGFAGDDFATLFDSGGNVLAQER